MRISIHRDHLKEAAALARQCSAAAVRERVLISQSAARSFRSYLEQVHNLSTRDGRSAQLKYVELLDICDFRVGNWFVELRAMMDVEQQALYVPTMSMMVGALSDYYVCAQVNRDLLEVEILGFVPRSDLAGAEVSANGLFAILSLEELQPFELLAEALKEEKGRISRLSTISTMATYLSQVLVFQADARDGSCDVKKTGVKKTSGNRKRSSL